MDVNFDGEEELVVAYPGYNRICYRCYDLINVPETLLNGFSEPISQEPYNNLVMSAYEDYPCAETIFDYDNKTITIDESIGIGYNIKTIASYYKPEYGNPYVRVTCREECETTQNGRSKRRYEIVDDTLKLVKKEFEAW